MLRSDTPDVVVRRGDRPGRPQILNPTSIIYPRNAEGGVPYIMTPTLDCLDWGTARAIGDDRPYIPPNNQRLFYLQYGKSRALALHSIFEMVTVLYIA